ncbi:MAG: type II toxin-antitoxin system VapC family toxin [Pseudomonadota bacterium]
MRLLLDTHAFLWWFAGEDRLSADVVRLMEAPETFLVLSAASSWEIAIKFRLGKLTLPEPPESFVATRMVREGIEGLPVQHSHALSVSSLPMHHRDPFDRMLIAQAMVEGLPILTADPAFAAYDVEVIPAGR